MPKSPLLLPKNRTETLRASLLSSWPGCLLLWPGTFKKQGLRRETVSVCTRQSQSSTRKCGAIAVPLFEAFGSDAIVDRLTDCGAEWLYATGKLAKNLNYAGLSPLKHILTDESINTPPGVSAHLMEPYFKGEPDSQTIQFGDLETPFIIHYTSGSTAKPKGILLANRAIGHMV